jgi:hypothetical protein
MDVGKNLLPYCTDFKRWIPSGGYNENEKMVLLHCRGPADHCGPDILQRPPACALIQHIPYSSELDSFADPIAHGNQPLSHPYYPQPFSLTSTLFLLQPNAATTRADARLPSLPGSDANDQSDHRR